MPYSPPVHSPIGSQSAAERRASYDAARGSRLYHTQRWRNLRKLVLDAQPLCACGCGYAATVVDHEPPHDGTPETFFDRARLRAMTKACHDRKTATQDSGFAARGRRR